jgi:hypothetical protein
MWRTVESYRLRFWPIFLVLFVGGRCLTLDLVMMDHRLNIHLSALVGSTVFLAAITTPLALLVASACTVRIDRDGLSRVEGWGLERKTVAWQDIVRVKPLNLPGFSTLRIWSRQKRHALRLPLFLVREARFRERVCELAGPLNPLTRYLQGDGALPRVTRIERATVPTP